MHRRLIGLIGIVFAVGGCSYQMPRYSEVVPPAEMRKKLSHDQQRLAGIDSPRHVQETYFGVDVTGQAAATAFYMVMEAIPVRIYKSFHQKYPSDYVAEMEDAKNPDHRREGISQLVKLRWVRTNPVYSKRFDQIARDTEVDYTVRAEAIRAMNYSRSKIGHQTFVDSLDDPQPAIRLEAAKALSNLPDDTAVPKLIAHMERDDNKDVRIACADALRNYKTPEVARALIGQLPDREFSVAFRARESLILMTGHNFKFEEADWLNYFATAKTPFHS
jgi:hypothetical protein